MEIVLYNSGGTKLCDNVVNRVLRLEGHRPASYRAFLGYLYTGKVECEGQEQLLGETLLLRLTLTSD